MSCVTFYHSSLRDDRIVGLALSAPGTGAEWIGPAIGYR
ncbi:hypothetical protein SAMN05444422_104100 [Halobiforma haloterrestris]|uniref:Uncharacterized protein n=1 Tax=Natronobacterium haloterrestre TaxID=148448 RepID=A0A1I1GBX0_NATHA|nr:hypothetical protein SAMN05444422_104100 [Halobiforma haloterrestris]